VIDTEMRYLTNIVDSLLEFKEGWNFDTQPFLFLDKHKQLI